MAGGLGLLLSPGCRVVETTAGVLADATEGTAAGSFFRGVQFAAEASRGYTLEEEHYIGRSVSVEILKRYRPLENQRLKDYVNLVGRTVSGAPEVRQPYLGHYSFVVVEGSEVQAVSTPGGFVFITEGAVLKARDEDELAGLLAHEVAHVSLGHGLKSISSATWKKSMAFLAKAGAEGAQIGTRGASAETQRLAEGAALLADTLQDITTTLLDKGYSRESEVAADKAAARYLESTAYARRALADYLRQIAPESHGGRGGWFATHPSPQDRVSQLGELAVGESPFRPLRRERFRGVVGGGG
jgi:predicted Zn-dependent protease